MATRQTLSDTPAVSVIIPALNGASFVDQALGSIATQTVPVAEVVFADDGSSDDTVDRVSRWADILPLKVVHATGRSTSARNTWQARHLAIEAASTDLILQLDVDDAFLPHHVATMIQAYTRTPGLIAPRRQFLLEEKFRGVPKYIQERLPAPPDQYEQILVQNYVGIGSLFSKEDYVTAGGYRACRYAEDWDLWIRFSAAGIPISFGDVASYLYRMHPSNTSSKVDRAVTDQEILYRFVDKGTSAHRRVAKLSILQRAGIDYVAGLQRVATAEVPTALAAQAAQVMAKGDRIEVYREADLGYLLLGGLTDPNGRQQLIVSADGTEITLRAVVAHDGTLESTVVDPALHWSRASALFKLV